MWLSEEVSSLVDSLWLYVRRFIDGKITRAEEWRGVRVVAEHVRFKPEGGPEL
jgi:hypothetical protein